MITRHARGEDQSRRPYEAHNDRPTWRAWTVPNRRSVRSTTSAYVPIGVSRWCLPPSFCRVVRCAFPSRAEGRFRRVSIAGGMRSGIACGDSAGWLVTVAGLVMVESTAAATDVEASRSRSTIFWVPMSCRGLFRSSYGVEANASDPDDGAKELK